MVKRIALLLLVGLTTGCSSWTSEVRPIGDVTKSRPVTVRIITQPDTRIVLEGTVVRSDTLFGREPGTKTVRAVPVSDIQSYEVWSPDGMKSFFAIVAAAAVLFGLGSLLSTVD